MGQIKGSEKKIPAVIHQIWSDLRMPLPGYFKVLCETWKNDYPEWEYILWNDRMMDDFVREHYPQYWDIYRRFPYDVQRWDAVRYLILDKMGGMYIDVDYESLSPIDKLIENKTCCFALEPKLHCKAFEKFKKKVEQVFNNAMMASIPGHPFMRKVINTVFREETLCYNASKQLCVYNTTGPWMLIDLYYDLTEEEKKDIYLIPSEYVTPFNLPQARQVIMGEAGEELEQYLENAYAVHYFWGGWKQ